MKKALSIFALTVLFSVSVNAQTKQVAKLKAQEPAKTEKSCCSADKKGANSSEKSVATEKKSCGTEAKASCCSSKKAEAKKEE